MALDSGYENNVKKRQKSSPKKRYKVFPETFFYMVCIYSHDILTPNSFISLWISIYTLELYLHTSMHKSISLKKPQIFPDPSPPPKIPDTSQEKEDSQIKIIENWQTYLTKSSLKPTTATFKHQHRPFRKGEKRLETLTPKWNAKMTEQTYLTPEYQLQFLQTIDQQEEQWVDFLKKQIKRKLNGYYNQDLKKGIFDTENAITVDKTIQLLLESFLDCYYCQQKVKVLYETVRDPLQWTLERLNNEYGHNHNNVVISCLQCNVRRRTMNSERYVKTKRMTTVEKIDDFSRFESESLIQTGS